MEDGERISVSDYNPRFVPFYCDPDFVIVERYLVSFASHALADLGGGRVGTAKGSPGECL